MKKEYETISSVRAAGLPSTSYVADPRTMEDVVTSGVRETAFKEGEKKGYERGYRKGRKSAFSEMLREAARGLDGED